MEIKKLLKETKKLELAVRRNVNEPFAGKYKSSFKGKGMEPFEIREYIPGDNIGDIDWKTTAKQNKPFIKIFKDTRELQTYLLLDISKSMFFGTQTQLKRDQAVKLCAAIALATLQTNDKIGLVLFTNEIQKYIQAKRGKKHAMHILREILNSDNKEGKTSIDSVLHFTNQIIKRHAICFLITDEIDIKITTALKICSKKHELIFIHIIDPAEEKIPNIGLTSFIDSESGENMVIDTNTHAFQAMYRTIYCEKKIELLSLLKKLKIDYLPVYTNSNIFKVLNDFFKKRIQRLH